MTNPKQFKDTRMCRISIFVFICFLIIGTQFKIGSAEPTGWGKVGARVGFSDSRNEEYFNQYEGFATYNLPWALNFENGWDLGTYIEMNAGVLEGGGDTGLVVSVGPGLSLTSPRKRLLLGVGVNPSLVSKTEYGREDIGGPFQFTLYAGLSWIFYRGLSVDYRYQHMSNAGIYSQNPGINQHMFGFSYNF
jgi:hypothetical protein